MLRRRVRDLRGELCEHDRTSSAYAAFARLKSMRVFHRSQKIAIYIGFDGEIDTAPIIAAALAARKTVFLPIIDQRDRMRFVRFNEDTELRSNRFGIPEPVFATDGMINPRWLDLVITPLVAFDVDGNRLGMGAGYYDKCFSFLLQRVVWRKPRLVGLAYEFQRQDALAVQSWDVPLDCIVTDENIHIPNRSTRRFQELQDITS